jgi:hypothetical protein
MLNKNKLKKLFKTYFTEFRKNPDKAAADMADIIDDYIKEAIVKSEGTVVIPTGLINVIGSAGSSTNVQPIIIKNIKNTGKLH